MNDFELRAVPNSLHKFEQKETEIDKFLEELTKLKAEITYKITSGVIKLEEKSEMQILKECVEQGLKMGDE